MEQEINNIPQSEKLILYSKQAILVCSIFLSPFFGSLLYYQNLIKIGKSKLGLLIIISSIIYLIIGNKALAFIGFPNYIIFIPLNLIGGLILTFPLWKIHFGDIEYTKRKVNTFVLIILSILILLVALQVLIR